MDLRVRLALHSFSRNFCSNQVKRLLSLCVAERNKRHSSSPAAFPAVGILVDGTPMGMHGDSIA
jgi:hypothetical protein